MMKLKKLVVRIFLSVLIVYSGFLAFRQYHDLRVINQTFKLEESVKIKLNNWYSNFLHINYNFDTDKKFNEEIDNILKSRGDDPELSSLKTKDLPLDISIPEYYFGEKLKTKKPKFQPFDPRLTLAVYFKWIEQHPNDPVQFHWSDWVDLSNLEKFLFASSKDMRVKCENLFDISNNEELIKDSTIRPVREYCKNYFDTLLGFKIIDNPGEQTIENHEVIGKSHLYTSFEPPTKLVLLSDKGNSEVEISHRDNNVKYGLLKNSYVEGVYGDKAETGKANTEASGKTATTVANGKTGVAVPTGLPKVDSKRDSKNDKRETKENSRSINVLENFKSMMKKIRVTSPPSVVHPEIILKKEMFKFDAKAKIKELEAIDSKALSLNQRMYLSSLKNSVGTEDPPKFFHEAKLLKSYSQSWLGEHYDWRFFNGLTVGKTEQQISLYKLIKTYLEFCNNEGLVTWIAHGSLLSWYWNGLIFPWDTDLDVQMPIGELNRLAEHFNQSMVIENVNKHGKFNGMGKYFVDIGSSITYREKGNGNNNIDGRFIDVDTGLYVDITGLAVTNSQAPSRYDSLTPDFVETTGIENLKKNDKFGLVNCRNNHFLKIDEVDTLKPVHFQDQLTYLSNNFLVMINDEYDLKSITEKNYRDYIYLKNFRIWVNTQNILDYINDPQEWMNKQRTQEKKLGKRVVGTLERLSINKLNYQDYINLLQDKGILREYLMNKAYTANHAEELNNLMYNKSYKYGVIKTSYVVDLFLNKIYENDWNYEQEVERIVGLSV